MSSALSERLEFMDLGPEAQANIRSIKPFIAEALPGALDSFYTQVRRFPKTRAFFSGEDQILSAKNRQVGHWETISSGQFDDRYVGAVTRVGQIHARIGLEPRWYIGGYSLVLERLIAKVVKERWPKGGFGGAKGVAPQQVAAELGALVKATLLDMDFAISVYLEAAEEARLKAEKAALAQERETVVGSVGQAMRALSAGDLTYRMSSDVPEEYAQLRADFNAAMAQLQQTVGAIMTSSGTLGGGAQEISSAADDLSRRTEQQAASLEETAAALDEVTSTVQRSAEGAQRANATASEAKADAVRSGDIMNEAVSAMDEIEESSGKITQIIGVIDEIAFQTNLLALNAGVEAARAGEAGRGFAVVAQEVRALAQRSADAAKEIKTLIARSSDQVERGARLVADTGQALHAIVAKVADIDSLIAEIARSAQEQAVGLTQVNTAINQMDQVTQQNAAMVEETTAAASRLQSEATELSRLIGSFEVGQARPAAHRPGPVASETRPGRRAAADRQRRRRPRMGGVLMADALEAGDVLELISFGVAGQEFCIDIRAVREIRGWTPATTVPNTPHYIRGVINLRGQVMPVMDLRARLGLGETEPTARHVVVVVQQGVQAAGLLVDGVQDTLRIAPDLLQSPPALQGGVEALVDAIIPLEGRMLSRLVLAALWADESRRAA
jgi:methyl-accepting chemotaxis protein